MCLRSVSHSGFVNELHLGINIKRVLLNVITILSKLYDLHYMHLFILFTQDYYQYFYAILYNICQPGKMPLYKYHDNSTRVDSFLL